MRGSWFKKTLGLGALCLAGPLMAAGPLDGIYQFGDAEDWLSMHQNGNHVVVGSFFNVAGPSYVTILGKQFQGNKAGIWELLGGDLAANGTSLTVSGESRYGACQATYFIDFSAPQIWVQWVSLTTTPAGAAQGIDCEGRYAAATVNGNWYKIKKIY
jgi:hypothetical protein